MGTGPLRPSLHVNTHDARVHRAVLCVESKISHKKRLGGFRAHARSGSAIIDIIDAKPMPVAATITKMNAVLEGRRLLLGRLLWPPSSLENKVEGEGGARGGRMGGEWGMESSRIDASHVV